MTRAAPASCAKPFGDGTRKATRLLWSAVLSSPWARAISARRSHSWKKPGNLTHMALAVALAYELEEQGSSAEAERVLRTRLSGRGSTKEDQLRLGLAWILLSRGERAQAPGHLEDAI